MKLNAKLLVVAMIITIIFSLSAVVAACENVTEISGDLTLVPHEQVVSVAEPTVQEVETINLETSYSNDDGENIVSSSSDDIKGTDSSVESLSESKNDQILSASNDEEILSQTIIPTGTKFEQIRNALKIAEDGDIIDLGGLTYTGVYLSMENFRKNITLMNGILDVEFSQPQNDRVSFTNAKLVNVTFKNVFFSNNNLGAVFGFNNCTLVNVSFENINVNSGLNVLRNTKLENCRFINLTSRLNKNNGNHENGAMNIAYYTEFNNCQFINCRSNQHSGGICVAGEIGNIVNITNCDFIKCHSGIGGAVYVHGTGTNSTYHSNIINCNFYNCDATEWGGALGSSQDYLLVENCKFINNTAKRGAAFMVGGITHELDGNNHEGHYNTIRNCYFFNNTGSEEGGAVHITGNYNTAVDCIFYDNFAINGNGAAIYVKGYHASVIDSKFHEHKTERGTVYIVGDNASVIGSIFEDNIASYGGAGVYIEGNNTLIDSTYFENNNATVHGGAVHSFGNNAVIINSQFIANNAIPHLEDITQGLGGAIYIRGHDNGIINCHFDNNTARNGSAIYNIGRDLHIYKGEFLENQAFSYLLITLAEPEFSYYSEDNPILLNTTLVGGDNIINAIYNDGLNTDIWFRDVTYQTSRGIKITDNFEINPVLGVENSENGEKIYQDSREDYQLLVLNVTNDETGRSVYFKRDRTGIYGNLSDILIGLPSGNYTLTALHPEDMLYKEISNFTKFRIVPQADVKVTKSVSDNNPDYLDTITWTITVINDGPSDAENVILRDLLPQGLVHLGDDSKGEYDAATGVWKIGYLAVNGEAVINIKTLVNISNINITNVAVVNSTTYDPNETNNEDNETIDVGPVADLAIEKIVSNKYPKNNEEITWTIKVTNNGPDTAVNARVYDVLPAGLFYISSDGNYNDTNNIWTIGDLSNNDTVYLNIRTRVIVSAAVITNIANVTSDTPDNDLTNNEDNDTIDVEHEADLEVIKVVSNSTPKYGDTVTWTITVINHGPDRAIDVVVDDNLPAGLIYIGDDSNGKYDPDTGLWDIGELAANNASVTLIITTQVNITNATITNIAVVSSDTHDPNPNNNEDNDTLTVEPVADLAIVKIVSNHNPKQNDEIIWTIRVTNNGPDTAVNARVYDVLPAGLELIGTYSDFSNNIWTIGDLANAQSAELNITTKVLVTNTNITNVANVTSDTPDNDLTNNEDNETIDIGHEADLEVIKVVSNSTPKYGDTVTWTITVINHGPDRAIDVVVDDNLPAGLIYIGDDSNGKYDPDTGLWDIGELAANNASVTLIITTLVNVTDTNITNIAVVSSDTYDPNPDNNEDNDTIEVSPMADIQVTKLVSNANAKNGETVTWTIIVFNNGPDTALNVIVKDNLPAGLIYQSDDGHGAYNHITGIWNVGNLNHNRGLTLNIITVVNATDTNITNIAVANSTTYDPNETNNEDNDTTEINPEADVSIIKVVSNPNPEFGETITWTITVINNGSDMAENVFVKDNIPQGLVYVDDDSDGRYDPSTGVWNVGNLTHKGEAVLIIRTLVNITNATITNVAVVNTTTYETDETNNEDNDTVDVGPVADLAIEKIVSNNYPKMNDEITWTIKVTNNGPDTAVNARVYDVLPAGLQFITSDGAYDSSTNTWTIGDLKYNGTVYLNIQTKVLVTAAVITNIANVTSDTPDGDLTNNEDNETIDIGHEADLEVIKVVSNSTPKYGDTVTWNITVINHGPDRAVDVHVTDKLPTGLIYISDDSNGDYNPETGVWQIGELENNNASVTLIITTLVNISNTTVTNIAVVNSSTHDNNESNNEDNDTITVEASADLEIIKTVNNHFPRKDDEVIWTIRVTNNGPDTAVNVRMTDILPAGLELIGAYENFTGNVWAIGNLRFRQSVEMNITTKVLLTNIKITNIANVTSDTPDSDLTNNEDHDTIDVGHEADLEVIKTVSDSTPKYGDIITWNITVINHGPDMAVEVAVADKLPSGLIYISDDSNGKYDPETGLWDIGDLAANNASVTLIITVQVDVTNANITNVAVVSSDTYDPNETNNEDNETVEVPPVADIEVTKTVSSNTSGYGDTLTWTITVFNHGPDTAVNVTVRDNIPHGLIYISDDGKGTYDPATGIWNVGDLINHRGLVLNILTLVNITNANVTNVAVGNTTTFDPNETNNEDNDTTEVDPKADLVVVKIVSNATSRFGDTVVWTLNVTNNGPDTAVNVKVIDKLPSGLIFESSDGDYDAGTGIWAVGNLTKGESRILKITTTVNTTDDTIVNVANVTSDTPGEWTNGTNQTTVPAEADLSIVKLVSENVTKKGDEIIWTIIVTNNGPDDAHDVYVRDFWPDELIFNDKFTVSRGVFDHVNLIWHITLLRNNHTETLTLHGIVNTTNINITNHVNVTSDTYDPNETNNEAENTTEVVPEADLQIIKTVSNSTPMKGDVINWTLTVINHGPDNAVNVKIMDTLPDGISLINGGKDILIELTLLEAGKNYTYTFQTVVEISNAVIVNVANVTSDTYDPDETNNEDDDAIDVPPLADLEIIKTVSNATPNYGDTVTWSITVINHGPDNATDVSVVEKLPYGLIYIIDDSNGKYNYTTGVWTIGDLANNNASVTLIITTQINVTNANITNIAVVNSTVYDPNETNNEDNETITVPPVADVEITKLVSNPTPKYGDEITWTIRVTNNGPDTAVNVQVTDIIPQGLELVGQYENYANNVWTIGNLTSGASKELVITTKVLVSDKKITNIANVTSDTYDPDETNNADNDTVDVLPLADLSIVKSVSNPAPRSGDVITWTISVTNNGPDTAKEVLVEDTLPNGLKFISGDVSIDNNRVYKIIDRIASGETVTITLKTQVILTNLNITNIANVSSNKTYDPNETNNEDNETVSVEPEADVSITKTVSNTRPKKGDLIVWTIKVTNHGPDTAVDVVVTEQLPDGLHLTRVEGSKGSYDNGIWKVGNLTNGQSATLTLTTRVLASSGTIRNIVVSNSSTYDPNETNNNDTEIVIVNDTDGSGHHDGGCNGDLNGEGSDDDSSSIYQPPHRSNPPKRTMHATGNPVLVVLLALLACAGVGFRKIRR